MTKDLGAFGGRQHPNQRRDQPARDDKKADRVAEIFDDGGARSVRQIGLEHTLRQHREADRQPCRERRPPQCPEAAGELALALDADDLVDHRGAKSLRCATERVSSLVRPSGGGGKSADAGAEAFLVAMRRPNPSLCERRFYPIPGLGDSILGGDLPAFRG